MRSTCPNEGLVRLVNEAMGGWPNHPFLNLSVGFPLDALTLASTLGLDNASARNAALELSLRISLLSGSREQGRLVSSGAIGGFGEGPRARSCCARGFRYRESGGKRPAQQALEPGRFWRLRKPENGRAWGGGGQACGASSRLAERGARGW